MGWVALTVRKASLKRAIHEHELRDIQISRTIRSNQRRLSYEQSVYNSDKTEELNTAKSSYMTIRNQRPDVKDENYAKWQQDYSNAKEDYEAEKLNINTYYDDIMNEIEEEATDEETTLQEEQTTLEAQLEAMRSELESVNEQISSDIDSSKINLS